MPSSRRRARLTEARAAVQALKALRDEAARASATLAAARGELPWHATACTDARTEAEKQGLVCRQAQEALADAERTDHAAACAHGSHPGDPCPVCRTILGKDFIAPKPKTDLARLRKAYQTAEAERRQADGVLGRCEGAQTTAEQTVARLSIDVEGREKVVAQQAKVAAAALPGVDLARPEAEALAGLSSVLDQQRQFDTAAVGVLTDAQLAIAKANAERDAASTALDKDERQFQADEKEWIRATGDAERRRDSLPASFRPDSGSTAEAIQLASGGAGQRLEDLRAVEHTRHAQEKLREAAQSALDDLTHREQSEVHAPANNAWTKLVTLRAAVAGASEVLGGEAPPDLDDAADISGRASQAKRLQGVGKDSLQALERAALATTKAVRESRSEALRILTEAGFGDVAELTTAIQDAVKFVGVAEAQVKHARARIEPARALSEVCGPFTQRIDALQVVKETVTQSTFVAEMRRRRETHLLRAASQELMGLSEDRYEFVVPDIGKKSDRFVIWDHYTQRERSPQTLSGGETFLASLALALGLSEILSRRSRRIESLWLDEGFASLDDSALDDAIAALERAAAGGRLIAVVTHLKKVMQSIDQVLAVQRTLNGSQAHWAGTTERARTAVEEAAAGLLT